MGLAAEVAENKRIKNTFEYQEKCAEQARKVFADNGYKKKEFASYENHYNEKLNKCFMMITDATEAQKGTVITSKVVLDAVEGKKVWRIFLAVR